MHTQSIMNCYVVYDVAESILQSEVGIRSKSDVSHKFLSKI